MTVAAAVAIAIVESTSRASVADGLTITSTGGALNVKSEANTDSSAKANGKATGGATLGVGAAVAINLVTIRNEAIVGANVLVDTHGLTRQRDDAQRLGQLDAQPALRRDGRRRRRQGRHRGRARADDRRHRDDGRDQVQRRRGRRRAISSTVAT